MEEPLADRIVNALQWYEPFNALPLKKRRQDTLWMAINDTLLKLRPAIYHVRLGKKPPKLAERQVAIQMALSLLGAFAYACGIHQAVVSTEYGRPRSISLQPRPFNYNWMAAHALSCDIEQRMPELVSVDDFMFLMVKTICAVAHYQMGRLRDGTSTFHFVMKDVPPVLVALIVREKNSGKSFDAYIKA